MNLRKAWLIAASLALTGACERGPAVSATSDDAARPLPGAIERVTGPVFAFAGDTGLGRRMNSIIAHKGAEWPLRDVADTINRAELAMVNLETAVGYEGEAGIDKGERAPYYFRARTESLDVLYHVGIDIVGTANNHALDYGIAGLLDGHRQLDAMRIAHPGSGTNRDQACGPVYRRAGELSVAVFSADATMPYFNASVDEPGTCFLSLTDADAWEAEFVERIQAARKRAHVVFIAVHWGHNKRKAPSEAIRKLAKRLIDIGFDAILGSSAHVLHGIGDYRGRPIIYDAGNFLFDFTVSENDRDLAAIFSLVLAPWGVKQVWVEPIQVRSRGSTKLLAGKKAHKALDKFVERSRVLGAQVVHDGKRAAIEFPPREIASTFPGNPLPPRVETVAAPKPSRKPPQGCTVSAVPDQAINIDDQLGPLRLVAASLPKPVLDGRQLLWIETFWRIDAPVTTDYLLNMRAYPADADQSVWSGRHEPCDWAWPTSRWEPGVIYRDRYAMRPPRNVSNGQLHVRVSLTDAERTKLTEPVPVVSALVRGR